MRYFELDVMLSLKYRKDDTTNQYQQNKEKSRNMKIISSFVIIFCIFFTFSLNYEFLKNKNKNAAAFLHLQ